MPALHVYTVHPPSVILIGLVRRRTCFTALSPSRVSMVIAYLQLSRIEGIRSPDFVTHVYPQLLKRAISWQHHAATAPEALRRRGFATCCRMLLVHGATYRDRTGDTWNHNPVLYRLS